MNHLTMGEIKLLNRYLKGDSRDGDITSSILGEQRGRFVITVEEPCVISGIEPVSHLFGSVGASVLLSNGIGSGFEVDKDGIILTVEGLSREILRAERTALNILSRMSGIATLSRKAQDIVEKASPGTRVAGTRKTTPGFTLFEKRALMDGGALPHRMDLSQMSMLKDNHIAALGGGPEGIKKGVTELRKLYGPYNLIEVEAEDLEQGIAALEAGADIIMLDNMSPGRCGEAAAYIRERSRELSRTVTLEASGGITMDNLVEYAPHVDVISLGFLTYGARPVGFRMEME
ncbi:MAG: carboxylating nicotinate-nucleotide diphosphorylase [Thermoplasmata archaeon]|nr:carboxylating nicotinate-nucleotide diphosphorylase [Thermoplasmata archaeon]